MTWSLKSVTRHVIVSDYAPTLHLHLLGPPEARLGETLLTFPTRKTLALLIYLALEGGSQPREHLATLLWPDSSPERSFYANLLELLKLHPHNVEDIYFTGTITSGITSCPVTVPDPFVAIQDWWRVKNCPWKPVSRFTTQEQGE